MRSHFAQNFAFASEGADAISEGFADYWAVTVSDVVSKALGVPEQEPLPCVADWDSVAYTTDVPHCLRRVDTDLHYPDDLNGKGAPRRPDLVAGALGHPPSPRQRRGGHAHPAGQFDFDGTTVPELAESTVDAADDLYGAAAAAVADGPRRVRRGHQAWRRPREARP